jgi:hypothetical protein
MKSIKLTIGTLVLGTALTFLSEKVIAQSNQFSVNFQVTSVDCYGHNNASIQTSVTGGVSPYTYVWSNGATTSNITDLMGGNYSVMITDAVGHQGIFSTLVDAPDTPLSIQSNVVNVSQYGGSNGVISVDITGGTEFKNNNPYIYSWSNGVNTLNQPNLVAGLYTLTVSDAHGCTVSKNFTVSQPFPVFLNTGVVNNQVIGGISTSVFPNPAPNNHFTAKWDNEVSSISVVSLRGESILSEKVSNTKSIDLSNIPTGEYIIYYFNNDTLLKTERVSVK